MGGGWLDGLAEAARVDDCVVARSLAGVDERSVCFGGGEAKGGEFGEGVFGRFFERDDGCLGERWLHRGGGGLFGEGGDDGLRRIHCDMGRGEVGWDAVFGWGFWWSAFGLGWCGGNRGGWVLFLGLGAEPVGGETEGQEGGDAEHRCHEGVAI